MAVQIRREIPIGEVAHMVAEALPITGYALTPDGHHRR
jgi:hypothetical protein